MLESMYYTLIGISFLCLILSVCIGNRDSHKLLSKAFLSGIAMILFGALSVASTNIEIAYCTSSTCATQSFFYEDSGYILWAFSLLSAAMLLVFAILTIVYFVKDKKE